jgi:hypothetical protein
MHTRKISIPLGPPGLHRAARALFRWATLPRPAQPCIISALPATPPRPVAHKIQTRRTSVLLSQALQACTGPHDHCWAMLPRHTQACTISALPGHCPKACHTQDTHTHDLHSARLCPPGLHRPAGYLLYKPVPLRPAKPGTHTHMISILLDLDPQACQARDPQTRRISTSPACALKAYQAHTTTVCYFTSAKGLQP